LWRIRLYLKVVVVSAVENLETVVSTAVELVAVEAVRNNL